MDDRERDEIVEALLARLRIEGTPQGTWLVEIAQAREALRSVEDLLARMQDALINSMTPRP